MNKEKKTEQINLRLTKSEKDMLYKNAGIDGKNVTEYIINLIKNNSKSVSYEQYITDSMTENNITILLVSHKAYSAKNLSVAGKLPPNTKWDATGCTDQRSPAN